MSTPSPEGLDDELLRSDIELFGEVCAATSAVDRQLTWDEIDELLGVPPRASDEGV